MGGIAVSSMRKGILLALPLVAVLIGAAAAAPNQFVTLSDGTEIAMNVRMPEGYVQGRRYPTIFEMSGYDGGSAAGGTLANDVGLDGLPVVPTSDSRQLSELFYGEYVTVHA